MNYPNLTTNTKPNIKKVKPNIKTISCNGGEKSSGHPAVYYSFGEKKRIQCQYCGAIFLKTK
jgi:uncharacterized Zn-finger protein